MDVTTPQPYTYWVVNDDTTEATLTIDLGKPTTFNVSLVQEYIPLGQRVQAYQIEVGPDWKPIVTGTTIGHKKLERFPEVTASQVRLRILQSQSAPLIRALGLYKEVHQ